MGWVKDGGWLLPEQFRAKLVLTDGLSVGVIP